MALKKGKNKTTNKQKKNAFNRSRSTKGQKNFADLQSDVSPILQAKFQDQKNLILDKNVIQNLRTQKYRIFTTYRNQGSDFLAILGRDPRAFLIGKFSYVNPEFGKFSKYSQLIIFSNVTYLIKVFHLEYLNNL